MFSMFSSEMVFQLTTFEVTFCTSVTVFGTFRTIKLRIKNSCPTTSSVYLKDILVFTMKIYFKVQDYAQ